MTAPRGLTWDAPGDGDWWLVKEHCPHSVSRMFSALFPQAIVGWKIGGARYGRVPDVFDAIRDGDLIEVDSSTGAVRVVERGS